MDDSGNGRDVDNDEERQRQQRDEETESSSSSSSFSSEEEEESSASRARTSTGHSLRSRGASALQSILSILVGRGDLGGGGIGAADTDSDNEEDTDPSFWPPLKRLNAVEPVKPDKRMVQNMKKTDYSYLTKKDLYLLNEDVNAPPTKMHKLLARREVGNPGGRHRNFSEAQKCTVYNQLLPNRKTQLVKHDSKLFCGMFSTNGDLFMSACQDSVIRVYDTRKGFKLMKQIHARNVGWSVLDVALSPDGRHLIYTSWCDYIHQVSVFGDEDMDTALPLCTDDGRFCLFSVRFSADGSEILGGANDGYIYLFDRERQTQSLRIHAHDDDVNAVSFVDTTTHVVASGGDDGFVKIWDRRALRESDPKPVGVLAGHVDGITFIDPKGDGRHLISNSKDQSIKLWDVRRFSSQSAVRATKAAVRNQNWDYRWQSVPPHLASAAGSAGNSRKRRSCGPASSGAASSRYLPSENDASIMTYRGHSVLQTLIRCHFSPAHTTGQRYIYTGCATGAVIVYDSLTGQVVRQLRGHNSCVRDVSWHPYKPEILSSSWDFTINKWEYSEPGVEEEKARDESARRYKNDGGDDDGGDGFGKRRERFLARALGNDLIPF